MNLNEQKIIDRIKKRRQELGLSYQDLADKTGLSKSTLQRYETGAISNIPLSKLNVLAKALQTTPTYIMGMDIDNQPQYDCYTNLKNLSPENQEKVKEYMNLLSIAEKKENKHANI